MPPIGLICRLLRLVTGLLQVVHGAGSVSGRALVLVRRLASRDNAGVGPRLVGGRDHGGGCDFVRRGEELVSLAVAPYEAEAVLQELLEHHPQLLAGYEMSRSDPRRFLLVCREAPVADQYGAGRWSLDHLFVDQDAIPTLVEVKRSSDTRIRREVVGQMLDYAANGTRYWGDGALSQLFGQTCAGAGRDPAAVLGEVAGQDADAQDFWDRAERNLRGGVVRLVFVADVIPDELATVIEFLNTKMHEVEVYGVEVRRYGSGGAAECFVPRLVGATAAGRAEKRSQTSLDEKLQNAAPEVITAAERLRFLGEEIGLPVRSTRQVCGSPTRWAPWYSFTPPTGRSSSRWTCCTVPDAKPKSAGCWKHFSRPPGSAGR